MLESDRALDGTHVSALTNGSEKRVVLVCDICGKCTETVWHNYIQYQRKVGWTGQTKCQPCAARQSGRAGKGRRNPATARRNSQQKAELHPSWRGGRYVDHQGYVQVFDRTGRSRCSYVKEHIFVVTEAIGRLLTDEELIHHINCDKQDNRIDNLWLTDSKGHREAHISLQDIGVQLVQAGLVGFDRELGVYFMADRKLRELLEQPGGANQQPSLGGDTSEGSETRGESFEDDKSPTSAGHCNAVMI